MAETARQLYDEDFYLWTQGQAEALRRLAAERWNGPLDLEHLAEEVEDLGRSERNAVRSQVVRILEHLLKLAYSPSTEPRGRWKKSVVDARNEIRHHMTRTIESHVASALPELYDSAREAAEVALEAHDEHEAAARLPEDCPFCWDDIVRSRWYPEGPEG